MSTSQTSVRPWGRWSRKRRAFSAVAIAAALLAAGCSGGSDAASSTASSTDGPVTITYGYWATEFTPAFQAAADAFHAKNPNVTVSLQLTPFDDYFTKLNTQIESKTAPDMFWLQNIHIKFYAKNGALADLSSDKAASTTDLSGVPAAVFDPYVIDGKLYAVPWQSLTFGLFYNKAIFDAAGVAEPTNDWTWDDVREAAKKLTDPGKGVYGIAARNWNYGAYYQTMYQAGADIISADGKSTDFASPAAIKGLNVWVDMMKDGSSPTLAQMSDTPVDQWFTSGKLGMIASGPWTAPTYQKSEIGSDVKVVKMPTFGDNDTTGYATTTTAVSAASTHPAESYAFAEFLTSDEGSKILSASGTAGPGVNSNARETYLKSVPDMGMENMLDELATAKLLPSSDNTAAWEDQEQAVLAPAYDGTATTEEVAQQMADIITKALAEEN